MAARTLRTQLMLWFFGAIVLAVASSVLVFDNTRPSGASGAEIMARTISTHLAEDWPDRRATEAYVQEVHDTTGFDVRLHHEPRLPPNVQRVADRGGFIAPAGPHRIFVPVKRGGHLVGALEINGFGFRPPLREWWPSFAALAAALVVLVVAAGAVSDRLARPLEQLTRAAQRFGHGDLAVRCDVAPAPKRWLAKEVQDVGVAFNEMADRIERMVRSQRELLGAISHELRSPLGRARIALEIARDRVTEEEPPVSARRSPSPQLDEIERQLGEVDKILGDLLAVTRAGLADVRKERMELVHWLRARLAEEARPPEIDLVVSVPSEPRVAGDGALLGRALHNLLANARAHGHPADAPLVVRVEPADSGRVAVVVRDRGPGFPPELIPRAFEPFVRGGDSSRTRTGSGAGSGLGLALVKRIAEAHGGEATAKNVDGGAEVAIVLPLA